MKNKPLTDELRELLWRRRLTDAERARAAGRPEVLAELELDARLTNALAQLPAAQVPSNFTARVLQAVDREEAPPQTLDGRWFWTRWLPRVAVTAAVVACAAVTWQRHELNEHRTAIVHTMAQLAGSSSLSPVEALDNYDAIQRMGQAQPADQKLLALLE
jgi:negative regulator of sigma E activity